ncbi:tyrosyl-dna phosphodiesterase 2 [Fagus crenata]
MDHDPDAAGSLKLDGTNYLLWSYMMRKFKIEGELWHRVIESESRADPKDKNYFNSRKELESMNAKALSIINSYVDRSLKERLAQIYNAKNAWDYLAGLYAHDDELEFAKKYRLEKEIEGVTQSGFPITVVCCYLLCYWQQLDEMEAMELSDLKSYKRYREESRLVQLLMALPDKFEPIRKSMLQRFSLPSVSEAVSQLSSLSLEDKDISKTGSDECLYCHQTGHLKADCPAKKKNNDQPFITNPILYSEEDYQPSSSSSRLASYLTPDNNQPALSTDQFPSVVNMTSQLKSDISGLSPPASGKYLPPFKREKNRSCTLKILNYNILHGLFEIDKRMEVLGEHIQLHSPDFICFQEVTCDIYDIFIVSSWWNTYNYCSISYEEAETKSTHFCMMLSKLPVKSYIYKPFSNSKMERGLCMVEIEVERGKLLTMNSEERVAQAKESLNDLKKFPNVVFCGDLNWIEDSDGPFPLLDGWIDPWIELRPRENGWTYDTMSNLMLCASKPAQAPLDRFVCNLRDFKLGAIDMIGMEAIPGLSFLKERWAGNRTHKLVLPVWLSDHYGLVLKINSHNDDKCV